MDALADWVQLLCEGTVEQRCEAARELYRRGPAAKAALPALMIVLNGDPEEAVRRCAAEAVEHLGPSAEFARELARKLAQPSESGYVRAVAGFALLRIAHEAPAVVQLVLPVLRDKNPFARLPAAFVLARLRQALDDVIPVLCEALRHWFPMFRDYAARAVHELGPVAAATRDALVEHLGKCAPAKAPRAELLQAMQETRIVVCALQGLGVESLPALVAALNHPDHIVATLLVPGVLAEYGEPALPYLTEAAASDDRGLQRAGLLGLDLLGPVAVPTLPLLRRLRDESTDEAWRTDLEQAISHIAQHSQV